MSKKMPHNYVEKQENVVAIWMCSQLHVEHLEKISGVKAFRNLFLRETLHPYIFNFDLSKHDSSCILIFSINMDGIETFLQK